ncbi:P-type conjugative transfer protein TrbL [Megasphaera stantonii]|uniref:P-type conjugative transfer protein TrbL n=1 Tax=Megasphaera stantonii TaxID=2144175 RepID=UPI00320AAD13
MDFSNTTIFNDILVFFERASVTGMLNLQPHAKYLVGVLAIIDLCTTWTLYEGELRMSQMISKIMKLGAFLFIIMNWAEINYAIMASFQYAGLTAANIPTDSVIQPSNIIDNGFKVVSNLMDGLSSVGMFNFGKALMYLITIGLVLVSFFFMAVQILITKIEFNVFASLAVILLPFGAVRYTNFLCQRCISAVFAFGVKLMVMYFMIGLIQSMAGTVEAIPEDAVTFADMLKQAVGYVVLGFLTWKIPNLAAMMIQGTPALDVSPAALKQYSQQAAGMPRSAASKAFSAYGNHRATLNTARIRAGVVPGTVGGTQIEPKGRSVGMEYMRELFRQNMANSMVGKSILRGANNSLYRSEDWVNWKTGKYKEDKQSNRNDYKDQN